MSSQFFLKKRGKHWYVRFAHELTFHSTGLTNRKDVVTFAQQEAAKLLSEAPDDGLGLPVSLLPREDGKQPYRLKKRGRYWYVRYANEKTFHSTRYASRVEAEHFVHKEYRRRANAKAPDAKLKDYARDFFKWDTCRWVARQRAKKRPCSKPVQDNRRGQLENHILPHFGSWGMSKITAVEVEDWMISLPLASQTINHILYCFRIVMREAKRQGIIEKNPLDDVEPMGKDFQPTSALTDKELEALFPADPAEFDRVWSEFQFGVMFALMVSSGMRPQEARALEWSSVIFDVSGVLIVQAVKASEEIGPTKGKERRGAIVPERTSNLLRRWQEMCEQDTGFVFQSIHGEFHSRKSVYNRFREGLKRAQILKKGRRVSMRSLRTTYNTRMRQMLLANAMSEDLLRFFIGHRSVQMTDRYDNPELEAKLRALQPVSKQVNGYWD